MDSWIIRPSTGNRNFHTCGANLKNEDFQKSFIKLKQNFLLFFIINSLEELETCTWNVSYKAYNFYSFLLLVILGWFY